MHRRPRPHPPVAAVIGMAFTLAAAAVFGIGLAQLRLSLVLLGAFLGVPALALDLRGAQLADRRFDIRWARRARLSALGAAVPPVSSLSLLVGLVGYVA